jgi:hypothetical protein
MSIIKNMSRDTSNVTKPGLDKKRDPMNEARCLLLGLLSWCVFICTGFLGFGLGVF